VPDSSASALAIFPNGVFRSLDRGNAWRAQGPRGDLRPYRGLAVAPSDPRRVYADFGYLRSDDGGQSWRTTAREITGEYVTVVAESFAVDPGNAETLYVGGYTYVGYGRQTEYFLVRSRDAGGSWEDVNPLGLEPLAIAVDPQQSATLYVLEGDGLFKSLDGGVSWNQVGQG